MTRGRKLLIPDEKLPEVRAAYEADRLSIGGVAERFGVSHATAEKALRRAGTKIATKARGVRLRRFEKHDEIGRVIHLPRGHDAIKGKTTIFPGRVVEAPRLDRILKSGVNSSKIGAAVTKGPFAGFPIYTLTLEERATCPSTCHHFHTCYGNTMNFAERIKAGPQLERGLEYELGKLAARHPGGYLVRAHVLGDFYSPSYVLRWLRWLRRWPALHVFGYTAWGTDSEIGRMICAAVSAHWPRFAIRHSVAADVGGFWPLAVTAWTVPEGPKYGNAIVCPAQTGKTDCCGTCGLCWGTREPIAFITH